MVEITENTKDLITSCMIQRLSTNEALDYLKENKIDISERTYRRYKEEILKQKNKLKSYSQKFVRITAMGGSIYKKVIWINNR